MTDQQEQAGSDGRLIFIGFSAAGKTTVARLVAERLAWGFIDTDEEIMRRSGRAIGQIFHGEGEESFRRYEWSILEEACRRPALVIAAGGGAVLPERHRRLMQETCYVVCLEARPETLYRRLLRDRALGSNPVAELLTRAPDALARIAYLKQYRQPYYAVAHWTVHTDDLTAGDVAEEVLHGWRYRRRALAEGRLEPPFAVQPYPRGDGRESDAPYSD